MLFPLSEFELLRASNTISARHGGTHLGTIGSVNAWRKSDGEIELYTGGTYRNQWLISVDLVDQAAPFGEAVPPGHHAWQIRMGFCQTQIQRAPNGGFPLTIDSLLLSQCPTVEHVAQLFNCMRGKQDERQEKLSHWYRQVQEWREARTPIAVDIRSFIREDVLRHELAQGRID